MDYAFDVIWEDSGVIMFLMMDIDSWNSQLGKKSIWWQGNSHKFKTVTTVNFLNIRTPRKICCNHYKIWTMWLYHRVMSPNDADGMAKSVDPNRTAPLGAVWSGSALFVQTYLSKNLGNLR